LDLKRTKVTVITPATTITKMSGPMLNSGTDKFAVEAEADGDVSTGG
jgi:hypothetical protein